MAPGSAGGATGRILHARADRAPGGGDELPGDLQRPHRRPHHGFRAGLRAGISPLPAAPAASRVAARAERYRGDRAVRGHGADRRRGRHRRGGRAARGILRHARDRRRRAPPGVVKLDGPDALDALLPLADFVILTVPHTPATEAFMNRARFRLMKRTAFFINIGRGRPTRLDDLVDALSAGEIAGAGLDVFEQEPLPTDHPLWTMPGVLITPHTAGFGPHLDERRFAVLLDNCRRFAAGQPLRNVVDKANWF